jgi:hypothetical protein
VHNVEVAGRRFAFARRGVLRVVFNSIGLASVFIQSTRSPHASTYAAAPLTIATPTFHYDRERTGWNANERALVPGAVRRPAFGPLWNSPPLDTVSIDGAMYPPHLYATPLYLDNVPIAAGSYNGRQFSVVFAATTNDFVYAINAFDVPGLPAVPAGAILWSTRVGVPTSFGLDGGVAVGILGTPVIDPNATPPALYVAADVAAGASHDWKVFALDVRSGDILPGWPLTITDGSLAPINENGPARFQPTSSMSQRGALNLSPDGDILYVPFGAYNDGGVGWLVAIDTRIPSLASAFSAAPSTAPVANGGMWGSGGPAVDRTGNVYVTTGNSPSGSESSRGVWGESLLVWPRSLPLHLTGTYTPWNYCQMDLADTDLAGSTPVVIPDLDPSTTSTPRLVAFGSKQGNVYLIDRDRISGQIDRRPPCAMDPRTDRSLFGRAARPYYGDAPGPLNVFGPYSETCTNVNYARMRTTPAYFRGADGRPYLIVAGATKQAACSQDPVPPGLARLAIVATPNQPAYLAVDAVDSVLRLYSPGPPIITSNGSDGPIAWVLDAGVHRNAPLAGGGVPHPVLSAVDATTMELLWQSRPEELNVGGKYNHAIVAHGIVLVGTDRIQAFGLGR